MLESGLYNVNCFDGLREINDKSIDLVLTDPPYNIGIAEWDKIPDYINWCGSWIKQCERVLKNTGSFYFWHSDMFQLSQLMEWIRINTKFVFNSFIIWDKGNFRSLSWKNPSQESDLRSWFNTCEYCVFFTLQSIDGSTKENDKESGYYSKCIYPIREYIRNAIIKKDGEIILKKINRLLGTADNGGGVASSILSIEKEKPCMITKQHYEILRREYEDLRREYEDLRREYEDLRREYEDLRFIHNLEKDHNNVWRCETENKIHICEKPQSLLTKIIRCSTNSGGIVLDLFAGSASTAIAAHRTGRKYICFEKDANYYKAASERLAKEKSMTPLFEPQEIYKQEGLTFDT